MIPGFSQLGTRRRASRQQQQQQQHQASLAPEEQARSRSGSSSSHHYHHHNHHHHHYHHHHHHQSHRPRLTRTQHGSLPDNPSSLQADLGSSSRPMDSHASERFYPRNRLPVLMQRRAESDAHRVALEARGRLDERLREAAFLGRRNNESNTLPRLAQYYFNALFSEDEEENLMWEDEHEWEASLSEWLAGRVGESWQSEWINDLSLPSSSAGASAEPIHGLSKSAVNALPREIVGQKSCKVKAGLQDQQEECSVCLEQFTTGQTLLCLPCKHKFHQACLTPWLEHHEQCPYCRAFILTSAGLVGGTSQARRRGQEDQEEDEEVEDILSWLERFETGTPRLRFNLNS